MFPFGAPSTARPPRRPRSTASLFVLGVYPSALHVRWTLPKWARSATAPVVGALAIADEPTVFWDGDNADGFVEDWKSAIGFRSGDEPDDWGHVHAAGNGTSGRPVRDRVLTPLNVTPDSTWFTDAVDRFFVKRGGGRPQQGDIVDSVYQPFAAKAGLRAASIPERPRPTKLVALAVREHRQRLRGELYEAAAPVVVTLGEEARQVLLSIADEATGAPTLPLSQGSRISEEYGRAGRVSVRGWGASWYAVAHPGNRTTYWTALHDEWIDEMKRRLDRKT